jgi:nitrite reductase/ring-hydroxylating ferredoxin subunit
MKDPVDPTITTPAREGLTGTAPAEAYLPATEGDEITRAPDGQAQDEQPKWRRDFPIDLPQDQYVARRDFMQFMVLISLAFTVGQFWVAVESWTRRRLGMPPLKKIADTAALPVGGSLVFAYPDETERCVLVRTEANVCLAYSQQCTHLSCAVIPRVDENRLVCPCHEGAFDLETGRPIAVTRVLVEVRGNEIFARGLERRTV